MAVEWVGPPDAVKVIDTETLSRAERAKARLPALSGPITSLTAPAPLAFPVAVP